MDRIPEEHIEVITQAMQFYVELGALVGEYDRLTSNLAVLKAARATAPAPIEGMEAELKTLEAGIGKVVDKCFEDYKCNIAIGRQSVLQIRAMLTHFEEMTAEYYKLQQARTILSASGIFAEDPFEGETEDQYNAQINLADRQLKAAAKEIEQLLPASYLAEPSHKL
jgi:hypothetical protein